MQTYVHPMHDFVTVAEIPLAELDKLDVAMCAQPKESLEKFYDRQERKPEVLTNAGFFATSTGESIFTIVDEGAEYSVDPNNAYGFGINGGNQIEYGKYESGKYKDFICGYPVLIVGGQPIHTDTASEINYRTKRTVMAVNDTSLFLICVDGPGMNFAELQGMLMSLPCIYAINLDGGGSSRMLIEGKKKVGSLWSRPVDSVIAVYIKKKTLFRVQAGAYTKERNAMKLRNQIRALNDTIGAGYSKAYVREVNGIYKVQIGAFSKRANADRVAADLTAHGFGCYVTTA